MELASLSFEEGDLLSRRSSLLPFLIPFKPSSTLPRLSSLASSPSPPFPAPASASVVRRRTRMYSLPSPPLLLLSPSRLFYVAHIFSR